ncbi:YchJ family metal-binding protein [Phycicoccus sp.]|uniref:YchJ family protein n=1 Tax=Phycicoccus sp. TaxID=1902410 RepID=UPI002BC5D0E8|nr:YchJ family metal-binding protein [Phycicoccus sp.]HMM96030.1 YchJ family metal-binding protein [Phycicoccus sp.]
MAETFGAGRGSSAWLKVSGVSDEVLDRESRCPCGGLVPGATFAECCGRLIESGRPAETAEAVMRSRYTAYSLADGQHLFRTWHPRTRPEHVEPEPWVRWVGLEVVDVVDGGPGDDTGVVEFRAAWVAGEGHTRQRGEVHERSRFERRAGRWLYVGAEGADVTGS